MNWKWAAGLTLGLFGAGVAVGYAAQQRGIPQDQISRWLLKGVTRRALVVADALYDALPDDENAQPLHDALKAAPPRPSEAT